MVTFLKPLWFEVESTTHNLLTLEKKFSLDEA